MIHGQTLLTVKPSVWVVYGTRQCNGSAHIKDTVAQFLHIVRQNLTPYLKFKKVLELLLQKKSQN